MKTMIVLLLILLASTAGFAVDQPDYHILKTDRPYSEIIANPYEWALTQFADGPIAGQEVSEYAKMVVKYGLSEAHIESPSYGSGLILLRQDMPGRVNEVLAFRRVDHGFLYIGHFPATWVAVSLEESPMFLVYEASGGHFGYIRKYQLREQGLALISSEGVWVGDGAPDENNARLHNLFSEKKTVKWARTPNQAL